MAAPSDSDAPTTEQAPVQAVGNPPAASPYDDLLCTICNLKACWMTPEAAGKASTAAGAAPESAKTSSAG
jgi:hypothetical protein